MVSSDFVQGFLFGVRIGNNINGNILDIEMKEITDALSGIASGSATIQPTGAEVRMKHPRLDAEPIIQLNVSYDQAVSKFLLDHLSREGAQDRKA